MKFRLILLSALLLGLFIASGCGGAPPAVEEPVAAGDGLTLRSPALEEGQGVPVKYTCDGADLSPPLGWSGGPAATEYWAIILTDRITPSRIFTHWIIFNIPASVRELTEGLPAAAELPDGSLQGRNDFGRIGYGGPCPPRGESHQYRFTIYALAEPLPSSAGDSRQQFIAAIEGKAVSQATLTVTYGR
jgi:hypothetical protein